MASSASGGFPKSARNARRLRLRALASARMATAEADFDEEGSTGDEVKVAFTSVSHKKGTAKHMDMDVVARVITRLSRAAATTVTLACFGAWRVHHQYLRLEEAARDRHAVRTQAAEKKYKDDNLAGAAQLVHMKEQALDTARAHDAFTAWSAMIDGFHDDGLTFAKFRRRNKLAAVRELVQSNEAVWEVSLVRSTFACWTTVLAEDSDEESLLQRVGLGMKHAPVLPAGDGHLLHVDEVCCRMLPVALAMDSTMDMDDKLATLLAHFEAEISTEEDVELFCVAAAAAVGRADPHDGDRR